LRSLLFFQTSGSEGSPKWVGLGREAFLASARAVNAHLEATSRDRWLIALPLHHVGGFSIFARSFESGASLVEWRQKWDATRFAERCAEEKITLTSLVPAQVFDLVQAKLGAPPSLRAMVVGGGSLEQDLGACAHALGWRLLQSYGMTETASQIATEPLDHLYQGFDADRLEVLAGFDLDLDADGRLTVRGEALASGYAIKRNAAWHWDAMDRKLGLVTRDRVELWSHGARQFLRFIGRDADFVKVLGELVNIPALQKRLDRLAEELIPAAPNPVLVWPVPDERRGTALVLAGEASAEILEQLREQFNFGVQGFERLLRSRRIHPLPRTALGKIDRPALNEILGR
jgi:O-succinylbenzoic acid--CoA ligase